MVKKKVAEQSQEQGTRLGEFGSAIMQIAEEKGIPKNVFGIPEFTKATPKMVFGIQ